MAATATGAVQQRVLLARRDRWRFALLAGVLAALALALGWRGEDWPAQLYRADLFSRAGFAQWNNQWFAGHYLPRYSVLFPPLGALLGVTTVMLLSSVAATWAFADLAATTMRGAARRAAVGWFAVGTVTNVLVGRATFALGLAFGVAAVAAMARRNRSAYLLAFLTPLASPVAGAFLVLGAGACWLADRRRAPVAVAACALSPMLLLAALFPEGGRFPYRFGHFAITVAVCALVAALVPARWRPVRIGAAALALVAVPVFFVPNPLGGNLARLAMTFGGPLLAGALWPRRRLVLVLLGLPILAWQWQPAVDAMVRAKADPSSRADFYAPLLAYLGDDPALRLEVPVTERHWETHYIAPRIALARGWERQADMEVNGIFYGGELTEATYVDWLMSNAVTHVALPDTDLDYSAVAEAELLRAGVDGLQLVWQNTDWQLWKVLDAEPMVDGPAELVSIEPDSFTVFVDEPGEVLVRLRYSPHWRVDGEACVAPDPDGWIQLHAEEAGELEVAQVFSGWGLLGAQGDTCVE